MGNEIKSSKTFNKLGLFIYLFQIVCDLKERKGIQ